MFARIQVTHKGKPQQDLTVCCYQSLKSAGEKEASLFRLEAGQHRDVLLSSWDSLLREEPL